MFDISRSMQLTDFFWPRWVHNWEEVSCEQNQEIQLFISKRTYECYSKSNFSGLVAKKVS